MIGLWNGFYKYQKDIVQKAVGFEKTNFAIEITSFDSKHFKGIVNDDVTTGGMKGTGEIVGYISNGKIFFKKFMPNESQIVDLQGARRTSDKKHRTLYYSGVFTTHKKQASGNWKFRPTLVFLYGFIPFLHNTKGTWSMNFSEENK